VDHLGSGKEEGIQEDTAEEEAAEGVPGGYSALHEQAGRSAVDP